MTQLGSISHANPNATNVSTDNIIKNDDDSLKNIIDAGLKKNFENETSMEKMEKLGGPKPPKPESTMHKVGRFLTGILGGLLLAAGIAAATIATCGIAAGVVAGVAAGVAGAAGIGLIAGAVHMRPKHPEALVPQNNTEELEALAPRKNTEKPSLPKTIRFDADEADAIWKAIETFDSKYPCKYEEQKLTAFFETLKKNSDGSPWEMEPGYINDFVSSLFKLNNIKDLALNAKNVLVVRHALIQFFANNANFSDDLRNCNSAQWRERFCTLLDGEMEQYAPGGDTPDAKVYARLAIFRAALSETDLENPGQKPAEENDPIALIEGTGTKVVEKETIKIVSLADTMKTPEEKERVRIEQELNGLKDMYEVPDNIAGDDENAALLFPGFKMKAKEAVSSLSLPSIDGFVANVLANNGIQALDVTPVSKLVVRHAVLQYFIRHPDAAPEARQVLYSNNACQTFANYLQLKMNTETDPVKRAHLQIFRAALLETTFQEKVTILRIQ